MLYFPIIRDLPMPTWMPFIGGEPFTFFQPIFNLADASISVGIITILLFQKRFFKDEEKAHTEKDETSDTKA
jgi:signal peptidase II